MSKLIMIHTFTTFRLAYAVRVDDDAVPEVISGKIIADQQEELYQTYCGERFETSYNITEEDVIKVFDTEHHYIKHVPKEQKLAYIRDYRTNKEEE